MDVLNSVDALVNHIKEVQEDVVNLSSESLLQMSGFIEKNNLEIDDDIARALQYQDIITQQLNATIDAIDSMRETIQSFSHKDVDVSQLQEQFAVILEDAKEKKSRFLGKATQESVETEDIEFF